MPNLSSVIIVGAGPTGLTLAAELASLGIHTRVIEKRSSPSPYSRAFGILPRTLELLDLRGQADGLVDRGLPWAHASMGDGRGWLDFSRLDTRYPYMLVIPQNRTEEHLSSWAREVGAIIERDAIVTGVRQTEDGVTVEVDGPDGSRLERADFIVGCDGVRSSVRELAGIAFQGRSYNKSLIVADVPLSNPPDPLVYARVGQRGMVSFFPFGDGMFRLIVLDHAHMNVPVSQPVTEEELRESCYAIIGDDFGLGTPLWASRYRSEQRLSDRYRLGRVLLAGDAAHTHIPSGGQGLQTGIADAMNLGWKLAAQLHGWAPPHLLDTYQAERRPIAFKSLRYTDLIYQFETSQSLPAKVLRSLAVRAMSLDLVEKSVVENLAGFSLQYPQSSPSSDKPPHKLTGRRISDAPFDGSTKNFTRLYEAFRSSMFVLIDQSYGGHCAGVVEQGWADRVTVIRSRVRSSSGRISEAMLLRPDGYVAWAGHAGHTPSLRAALRYWCGDAVSFRYNTTR